MGRRASTFVDATRREPCAVCGATGFCTRTRDGRTHMCRRESVWNGIPGRPGCDGLGQRWTWYVRGEGPVAARTDVEPVATRERASADVLDRVYGVLLDETELAAHHVARLTAPYPEGRGLAFGTVRRNGYRSLVSGHARVARTVAARFDGNTMAAVPGFYLNEDLARAKRYWSIAASGLLIPVRDAVGRIAAFQVRLDDAGPGGARYLWLSSARHGGPGPGTPPHVPLHDGATRDVVRITEGCLKADVATALDPDGILTVGFPGVDTWRTVLPVLEALGARTVHLAFDADCRRNRRVAFQLQACVRELARLGYRLVLEVWTTVKGIDDLFASGGRPRRVGEGT